jgi:DNA-binding GntR family transcriptional regulator
MTSAAERAYAYMKGAILNGSFPGGELLTEGQIAERVDVSRTPVREAMLRLEAEGMLRLYPKKGAMVVPVTAAEAEDVIEARAVLENWAARRLFVDGPADALALELDRLVEQMRAAQDAGDVGEFGALDRTFHETIVAAGRNDILTRVYRSLRERQICLSVSAIQASRERMTVAVSDHAKLAELLRSGDAEEFVSLLDQHMDAAAAHLRKTR